MSRERWLNSLCLENLEKLKSVLEKDLRFIKQKIKQKIKEKKENEKKNIRKI